MLLIETRIRSRTIKSRLRPRNSNSRNGGPTSGLTGLLSNNILPYGASANLLISRPLSFADAYGFLLVPGYSGSAPAILVTDAAHGAVIYFSFAPEYAVASPWSFQAFKPPAREWTLA